MGNARIRPPWWLKPLNKTLMAGVRIGLIKDGPVVLTVTGRKSGRLRSTPITPFEVDGRRYVVGGFPGADWVRNAQAHPEATLTRGKVREPVRMVELPAEEARPLLRQFPTLVPTGVDFMKNAGLVTGANPDEFERLAGRCAVFRFDSV
ncbi:nitroreductase family deazaflavin-dependent oxidoreductase [Mycobacterium sp. pV006]|uniref:nitroreductase family deazaflavin-dependent oxidoreductase n=1 Tax=Mycobacterium sp. pV006 TaxID=3238983 RepID=UPI00351BA36E